MSDSTTSFVYAIQDTVTKSIKIGIAKCIKTRSIELRVGNPSALRVIAFWKGGQAEETAAHRSLARYRKSGEWFRHHLSVVEYIFLRNIATKSELDQINEQTAYKKPKSKDRHAQSLIAMNVRIKAEIVRKMDLAVNQEGCTIRQFVEDALMLRINEVLRGDTSR